MKPFIESKWRAYRARREFRRKLESLRRGMTEDELQHLLGAPSSFFHDKTQEYGDLVIWVYERALGVNKDFALALEHGRFSHAWYRVMPPG